MGYFEAFILALIEGLTEFLPVSSTGHMVIASSLMGIGNDPFVKLFEVAVQLGAILAVVFVYWKKFLDFSNWKFYVKLIVAITPSLVLGYFLNDFIDQNLENPIFIAIVLVLGGVILLFIDQVFNKKYTIETEAGISNFTALKIGGFQVLAIIFPGLSRSAATIIGGMCQKLNKSLAAEFSFFLAVPTMFAATGYKLLKGAALLNTDNVKLLIFGNVIAFIVSIFAIKTFIDFLTKHGFRIFGWYRIFLGLLVLALLLFGVQIHT